MGLFGGGGGVPVRAAGGVAVSENGEFPGGDRDQSAAGSGGRQPRGATGRRGRERRPPGFNDGLDHAVCLARGHVPPPDFPVQHRTGVATLRRRVVARRPDALLLCDGEHQGPHRWPDGEIAPEEGDTDLATG